MTAAPLGQMNKAQSILHAQGPTGDANDLPVSRKRFADGGQYRIENPSCEGPVAMRAAIGLALLHRHYPEADASPCA
jgi:hypothetical protein